MHRVLPPGPGRGMLFLVEPPQPFSLWMANTLVPLDMLFAGPDGRIVMIATGQPLDRTPVMCPVPVRAALEIAGGAASALGIRSGDDEVRPACGRARTDARIGGRLPVPVR